MEKYGYHILIVVIIITAIAGFLLLREIFCWYFKINQRLALQQKTLETMLKIYEQNGGNVNWEEVQKIIN